MIKAKNLLILFLAIIAGVVGFFWTKNRIGDSNFEVKNEQKFTAAPAPPTSAPAPSNYPQTLGNFLVTDKDVCLEKGKPLVYFFGSESCLHCRWERPIVERVAQKFGGEIDFHKNIDTQADGDVFQRYSDINPGYVPFLVLGCKYVKVGAGESLGKDDAESQKLEEEALTAILCKLTKGKPNAVCDLVKDKTSTIK